VNYSGKIAVVGVGRTKALRKDSPPELALVAEAVRKALASAGIRHDQLDGLLTGPGSHEIMMDKLPELLGLPNVQWAWQHWRHGRNLPVAIADACWGVLSGQAKYVAYVRAASVFSGYSGVQAGGEADREGGGPHLESPPYGLISIGGGAALAWRRYLYRYGYDEELLAAVPIAARRWALKNPNAYWFGRSEITVEDYLDSSYIVEPLRLYDHNIPANAAFCIIVTAVERAREAPFRPVLVAGLQGSRSGRETCLMSRSGLGVWQQSDRFERPPTPVYGVAGVERSDIDVLGIWDGFASNITFALEDYGFCDEGEGLAFVQGGRIGPGGEFPLNTGGGNLADVNCGGVNTFIELVEQLRDEAAERQIAGARTAQYASTDMSSIIIQGDR
jgi:acetyl-CoA acetyltransferase